MKKYYMVTGLDDGVEIEPYVISVTNSPNDVTLEVHCGDFFNPRYFDEITLEEYNRMLKSENNF